MGLLSNITVDDTIEDKDVVSGASFKPVPSGVYLVTVTTAYVFESNSGAKAVRLVLTTDDKQHQITESIYITSSADANKATFKYPLVNSLVEILLNKQLIDIEPEKKVTPIRNFDTREDVLTEVDMLTEIMDKKIYVGIQHLIENKKDPNNNWAKTNTPREFNRIDKFFREADKLTSNQIKKGQTKATFYEEWFKKNNGVTIDTFTPLPGVAPAADTAVPIPPSAATANIFDED